MDREGWIPYSDSLGESWDRFVTSHPSGRFIHLRGFKRTVEVVYGMKPEYWLHARRGRIEAVFPCFHYRSLLFGKRLVSQPFSEYGGILFSSRLDAGSPRPGGFASPLEALFRSVASGR